MFKVNIEKNVKSSVKKHIKQYDDIATLSEIKGLIGFEDQKDNQLIRKLSSNCANLEIEKKLGKKIELENLNNRYEGKAMSYDQIERLAIKYRLRFLPSSLFIGSFSGKAIQALKDFAASKNIELNDHTLSSNFYILAPANMFKLENGVERSPLLTIKLDPSLFYKDNLKDAYVHIKTWGSSFTILRRIRGMIWATDRSFLFAWTFITTILLSVFFGYVSNMFIFNPVGNWFAIVLPSAFIGLLAVIIKDGHFSCQVWNDKRKNSDREHKI